MRAYEHTLAHADAIRCSVTAPLQAQFLYKEVDDNS